MTERLLRGRPAPKLRPAELRRYDKGPLERDTGDERKAPPGVKYVTQKEAAGWFTGRHLLTPEQCKPLANLCNSYLVTDHDLLASRHRDAYRADVAEAAATARTLRKQLDAICTKRASVMPRHVQQDMASLMAELRSFGASVQRPRGNQPAEWAHLVPDWARVVTAVLREAGARNPSHRTKDGPVAKVLGAMLERIFGYHVDATVVGQVLQRASKAATQRARR